MDKIGKLFVISGPSGVGKGTICKELMKRNSNLVYSISATTREARKGEVHGKNYFFLSMDDFEGMISDNDLLEYANVYGNYYGTPRNFVEEKIKHGQHVILEIDPQGATQIREKAPEAVFIFIEPPSIEELRARIMGRNTDTAESIAIRLSSAESEINMAYLYDYRVLNDTVDRAVQKIESIILAEECRVKKDMKDTGEQI